MSDFASNYGNMTRDNKSMAGMDGMELNKVAGVMKRQK